MLVFDLDGTLVETREANLKAYEMAGVTPPENFNVVPWQTWATAEEHAAKNDNLRLTMPTYAKPLPLLNVAKTCKDVLVVSNISLAALSILRDCFPIFCHLQIHYGLNKHGKLKVLNMVDAVNGESTYIDDSMDNCKHIKSNLQHWTVFQVASNGSDLVLHIY